MLTIVGNKPTQDRAKSLIFISSRYSRLQGSTHTDRIFHWNLGAESNDFFKKIYIDFDFKSKEFRFL